MPHAVALARPEKINLLQLVAVEALDNKFQDAGAVDNSGKQPHVATALLKRPRDKSSAKGPVTLPAKLPPFVKKFENLLGGHGKVGAKLVKAKKKAIELLLVALAVAKKILALLENCLQPLHGYFFSMCHR